MVSPVHRSEAITGFEKVTDVPCSLLPFAALCNHAFIKFMFAVYRVRNSETCLIFNIIFNAGKRTLNDLLQYNTI